MITLILIFIAGIIETFLSTAYLVSVDNRKLYISTFLMFSYMLAYLFIVAYAIKDSSTYSLLIVYALSCAVGNYITIYLDIKESKKRKSQRIWFKFCKWLRTYEKNKKL
jgi:hypothetical protein